MNGGSSSSIATHASNPPPSFASTRCVGCVAFFGFAVTIFSTFSIIYIVLDFFACEVWS
jgi:hypothetical protein